MIIEVLQLAKMILLGVFYYLPIHLMIFIVLPITLRNIRARKYVGAASLSRKVKVSVVVPEFNEEIKIFEKCIKSIVENKPDEIIVVHDDAREKIRVLAEKYGAKVYSFPRRVGKRAALVKGWEMATGDIIVQVDSDVYLAKNAIDEIIKPFSDQLVVGVQGKFIVYENGSWASYCLSRIIEVNRDLTNKALNGFLVVIDGRLCAWRREWLLRQKESFLNEYFMGRRCEFGDDRFLTQMANHQGYKTCYQDTAIAFSAPPPTLKSFLKQQIRWARSGYKAFFRDFKLGLWKRAPLAYIVHTLCYYLAPISFTLSIIQGIFFAEPVLSIPLWLTIPVAIIGSCIISLIRRLAAYTYDITPKEFLFVGFASLFLLYPLKLYALATIRKQQNWLTR